MVLSSFADTLEDLIEELALFIEIAHFCVVIYGVRKEWESDKARKQPVATYMTSVACCFGGGMLTSLAVGKPALTPLSNNTSVSLMTVIWWLIFYCPLDAVFRLLSWQPVFMILLMMKEMIRTRKIIKGVNLARGVFPNSLLICSFVGMLAACGGGFVKNAAGIMRKQWGPHSIKSMYLSPITKLSFLFSLLYNLQLLNILDVRFNNIVMLQFSVMSLTSIDSKFGSSRDIFQGPESVVTSLAFDYSAFGVDYKETEKPKPKKFTKAD